MSVPFSTYQQALAREGNYSRPDKIYKDLFFNREHDSLPPDVVAARENLIKQGDSPYDSTGKAVELCWVCGWNAYNELLSSYGSRVRIIYTKANLGLWELGSRWLLRDQPNDLTLGNDFMTQEWLRTKHAELKIPLAKMQGLSEPEDKIHLLLMERAKGETLESIWQDLTAEEKASYTRQMIDIVRSWRTLTAPGAQRVDGSLTHDVITANRWGFRAPGCAILGCNDEEWFQNLEEVIRAGIAHNVEKVDEICHKMKANFPKSERYVLTHGDLNLTNIIARDGKIEAILDWEAAAFMPWWVERWLQLLHGTAKSDEFFDAVFAEIDDGMDRSTFQEKIVVNVPPVVDAWHAGDFRVDHTDFHTHYLRPGFCECKPYAGRFKWGDLGNKLGHKVPKWTK